MDYDSKVIFDTNGYEEYICNRTSLFIPLKDAKYTMTIYGSSAQEQFKILLGIDES